MKKNAAKLRLHRETLKSLGAPETIAARVAGGANSEVPCTYFCQAPSYYNGDSWCVCE